MKKILKSRYIRLLACILTLTTATIGMPVEAIVHPPKSPYDPPKPMTLQQLRQLAEKSSRPAKQKRQADVKVLTPQEMGRLYGRGEHRNQYFCGTVPWHRSFRSVDVCSGNLFKSFTDIQIAPGRGAGLVLQRTYNSNDDHVGPFGRGWGQAYDIRMQEATSIGSSIKTGEDAAVDAMDNAVRTDFFGGEHVYKRDADGLYTPPPYSHDLLSSNYNDVLADGPTLVSADEQTSLDGTTKHFTAIGDARYCDWIKDKYGNTTTLTYGASVDGVQVPNLLDHVTDPTGRSLYFSWQNKNTTGEGDPAYRITAAVAKDRDGSEIPGLRVQYDYYGSSETGNGGEPYTLKAVHLDPTGIDRLTTYTYEAREGENGLLAGIVDPQGNAMAYDYALADDTNTICVSQVTEPGGVDSNGPRLPLTWTFYFDTYVYNTERDCLICGSGNPVASWVPEMQFGIDRGTLRLSYADAKTGYVAPEYIDYQWAYDGSNNVTCCVHPDRSGLAKEFEAVEWIEDDYPPGSTRDFYTYGRNGNALTHYVGGYPEVDEYRYYDEDKYYQKKMVIRWRDASHMNANTSSDQTLMDNGLPDSDGRLIASYDYNSLGDVTVARHADYPNTNSQFTYTYYASGQKESETNLNGVVTNYFYEDDYGNLTRVQQDPTGLNRVTEMTYYPAGQVHTRTDPNGRTSTVTYNHCGQPLTASFAETTNTPAETITYTYCGNDYPLNDPDSNRPEDPDSHNGGNGRLLSVADHHGTTSMTYETGCDRVASVTDSVTGKIMYTYTLLGALESKSLPNGSYWTYEYWHDGDPNLLPSSRMVSMNDSADPESCAEVLDSIKYHTGPSDEAGRLMLSDCGNNCGQVKFDIVTGSTGNGQTGVTSYCVMQRFYDDALHSYHRCMPSRIVRVINRQHFMVDDGPTLGGQEAYHWEERVLTQNDYTYDWMGNRKTNTIAIRGKQTRTESYDYDALNRLTHVNYGDGQQQTYTFDPMGNRETLVDTANGNKTYEYDAANRLTTLNTETYGTYDNNGNTLTGGGRTNTWDSQNRLTQCVRTVNDVTTTSSFTYGSDGLRRSMTVQKGDDDPVTTHYLLDGQSVVQEFRDGNSNGTIEGNEAIATYLAGPRGVEYRQDASGARSWYLYDGLGSVIAEVNEGNESTPPQVTASRSYDVYGAVRSSDGSSASSHKFCGGLGHTSDDSTGLTYMRARYYDPTVGRFISEDPKQDGTNWYAYCENNPVTRVDFTGKSTEFGSPILLVLALACATILCADFGVKDLAIYDKLQRGESQTYQVGVFWAITIGKDDDNNPYFGVDLLVPAVPTIGNERTDYGC